MSEDALLDAIVAEPDNDDPRLVWADCEGGERGELVVVQCALAKGGRPREELRRLYAREAELLAMLGREPYVRGFVEHAEVFCERWRAPAAQTELFARAPLVTRIKILDAEVTAPSYATPSWTGVEGWIEESFRALTPGRIRAVRASPSFTNGGGYVRVAYYGADFLAVLARTDAGRALRSIAVDAPLGAEALPHLRAFPDLEALVARLDLDGDGWCTMLRAQPKLTSVTAYGLTQATVGPAIERLARDCVALQLTELDFSSTCLSEEEVLLIAGSPMFANLVRLGLRGSKLTPAALRALASSPHLASLRQLDLSEGGLNDDTLPILTTATFAPHLRALWAVDSTFTEAAVPHLLAFPRLERLHIATSHGDAAKIAAALDAIPFVSR